MFAMISAIGAEIMLKSRVIKRVCFFNGGHIKDVSLVRRSRELSKATVLSYSIFSLFSCHVIIANILNLTLKTTFVQCLFVYDCQVVHQTLSHLPRSETS